MEQNSHSEAIIISLYEIITNLPRDIYPILVSFTWRFLAAW